MAQEIVFRDNAAEILGMLKTARARALFKIGAACQGYTQDNTPIRTGSLAGSWTVEIREDDSEVIVGVPKNYVSPQGQQPSKYALYVEVGSRNNKPRNMLRRACTEHTDEYKKLARQAFEHA